MDLPDVRAHACKCADAPVLRTHFKIDGKATEQVFTTGCQSRWGSQFDLPPAFVPLVMLVRQGLEQGRQAGRSPALAPFSSVQVATSP